MSAIEVEGVSRSFGALRAVDGVSLAVEPGEICGLVGPNGSGKTTLLNLISRTLDLDSGSIRVYGSEVRHLGTHLVARMGVRRTFQLLRLLEGATVKENVVAGLYTAPHLARPSRRMFHGQFGRRAAAAQRAEIAMARLGISHLQNEYATELAYGFQRRVEFARLIVAEPRVLLLDEPTAGMTEEEMDNLEVLIREEASRGCAVLVVDHHLRFVFDICPRIAVMNFGRKIFDGEPDEAVETPEVREAYFG